MLLGFLSCGAVAQLGERLNGIQEVVRSIPISSTNEPFDSRSRAGESEGLGKIGCLILFYFPVSHLQFTKKIPIETRGRPTMRETVNSSLRNTIPERTPKIGVKNVNAVSLLTE